MFPLNHNRFGGNVKRLQIKMKCPLKAAHVERVHLVPCDSDLLQFVMESITSSTLVEEKTELFDPFFAFQMIHILPLKEYRKFKIENFILCCK